MESTSGADMCGSRCRFARPFFFTLVVLSSLSIVSETFALSVSPGVLNYSASSSSPVPASQTITFSKNSMVSKNWTVTGNASWISVSPSTGTIAREKDQVVVSVNALGLASGTYSGVVSINVGGQLTTIPLSLTVSGSTSTPTSTSTGLTSTPTSTSPIPSIQLNPVSLNFSATAGGVTPLAQTFTISNPAGGTLVWTLTEPAAWLGLNMASGTTTTEVDAVSASVGISGLVVGTYRTAITVSASGSSNTPQVIPVTLTVTPPTTNGTATLTWTANTETNLTGYNVYMGTRPGTYGAPISVGTATTYTASNLTGGATYYFTVTALNNSGGESLHSSEVSKPIY
jgi:Viral BACON domain/Fibronectin type III domain